MATGMAMTTKTVAPITATIVTVTGAPEVGSLVDALEREVIEVEVCPDAALDGDVPAGTVIVVWVPPGRPAGFFERVVAWASGREVRPGLLGCAPDGDTGDAEKALAAGFDDFVAGRASTRELAARLRAVHRRVNWSGWRTPGRLRYGKLVLETDRHELWLDGRTVTLTGTELSVLRALMRSRGRTLSRAELLDRAWGEGNLDIGERAVDNVILRLRRKLDDPSLIQTVRGVGFRLAID
jgi:DNA-binding response OmpR family regulator